MQAVPRRLIYFHFRDACTLGMVIMLHIGLFYALPNGSMQHVSPPLPRTISVFLITPAAEKPTPEKPPPAAHSLSTAALKAHPIIHQSVHKKTSRPKQLAETNAEPSPLPALEPHQAISAALPPAAVHDMPAPQQTLPQRPTSSKQPKTIASGIAYIQPPQPIYPPIAKRMEEEGVVTLRVLVNEEGRAQQVNIQKTSGSTRLDEAARQAMMRAIFKPHIEGGRPVAMNAIAVVTFKLDR